MQGRARARSAQRSHLQGRHLGESVSLCAAPYGQLGGRTLRGRDARTRSGDNRAREKTSRQSHSRSAAQDRATTKMSPSPLGRDARRWALSRTRLASLRAVRHDASPKAPHSASLARCARSSRRRRHGTKATRAALSGVLEGLAQSVACKIPNLVVGGSSPSLLTFFFRRLRARRRPQLSPRLLSRRPWSARRHARRSAIPATCERGTCPSV